MRKNIGDDFGESQDGRSYDGASAVWSTASGRINQQQTFEIWLKLGVMILLPMICLLCFATTLVVTELKVAKNAEVLEDVIVLTEEVHKVGVEIMRERGETNIYITSHYLLHHETMIHEREAVDNRTAKYDEYVASVRDHLPEIVVLKLAAFSGMLKDIPKERAAVDAHTADAHHAEEFYNDIVTYGGGIIDSLIPDITERADSVKFSVITALVYAEDVTGRIRDHLTDELADDAVTPQSLVAVQALDGVRLDALEYAYGVAPEYIQTRLKDHAFDGANPVFSGQLLANLVQHNNLDAYTQNGEKPLLVWFDSFTATMEELATLNTALAFELEQEAHDAVSAAAIHKAVAITLVCLCMGLGLGLAFLTAASVAKPFKRLAKSKSSLTSEVNILSMNNDAFSRFVPFDLFPILNLNDVTEVRSGHSASSRVTMLVGDIVDFTIMSAQYGPDEVFKMINAWLQGILPICKKHQAIVDKFIGDGVVAYFHRPIECINAGIAMAYWAADVNSQRQQTGGYALYFGLGANTGELSLGTVALGNRIDTLSMSDAMDLTIAIEHATRQYKTMFMATGNTLHAVGQTEIFSRQVGTVSSHKHSNVPIFEVLDAVVDASERQGKIDTEEYFTAALQECEKGEYSEALQHLETCLRRCPGDGAALHYKNYCLKKRDDAASA